MSGLLAAEDRLRALMLASLDGDAASYRGLLAELRDRLHRYFRRRVRADLLDQVEDLVQETLLAMHTRRLTYDPRLPFTAWVYAIARHKLADLLRRSRRHAAAAHVPIDDLADFLRAEPGELASAGARRDLDKVLAALPARVGTLIRRVKVEERPVAEVAAASGMSEGAVKVAVHRGLKALAARFGGGP